MISIDESGLLHTSQSFLHPLTGITEMELPEDSPFLVALDALKILLSPTSINCEAKKILVENCMRAFITALRQGEGRNASIEKMSAVGLLLQRYVTTCLRFILRPNVHPLPLVLLMQRLEQ